MVVDIGGGTTEVGVISLGGIGQRARRRRQVRRGHHQLHPPQLRHADRRAHRRVHQEEHRLGLPRQRGEGDGSEGPQPRRGVPRSFTISSNEILEALTDPLNQIGRAVKNALEQTPPELGADIAERGMMLTGGGALLRDLDRLLAEETGLPVLVAEDPLTCVVRGCGMALERMERLGSIFTRRNGQSPQSWLKAAPGAQSPCRQGTLPALDPAPPHSSVRARRRCRGRLPFFSALPRVPRWSADALSAIVRRMRRHGFRYRLPVRACAAPVELGGRWRDSPPPGPRGKQACALADERRWPHCPPPRADQRRGRERACAPAGPRDGGTGAQRGRRGAVRAATLLAQVFVDRGSHAGRGRPATR